MLFNWKRALSGAMAAGMIVCAAAFPVSASSYPAIGATKDAEMWHPIEHGIKSPYPIKGTNKITYWAELDSALGGNVKTYADAQWAKNVTKATGINVTFVHPASGQTQSAFNVATATRDLEDIVEAQWNRWYSGGGSGALKDKVVVSIKGWLSDGTLPYLSAYLKDNPTLDKQVRTDTNDYYIFPFVRPTEKLKTTSGPIWRQDWLDSLGLAVPETVAEWEVALTGFKDKKGAKSPMSQYTDSASSVTGIAHTFGSAYGFRSTTFYIDANGKTVKYAPYTSGWKDFLTLLNKWYKAGLLDKDFATMTDRNLLTTKFSTGQTGVAYGRGGGDVGNWIPDMTAKDPNVVITGSKFPVLKKGDKILYSGSDNFYVDNSKGNCAVAYTSKKQKIAAQFLDFAYSPQGHMMYNFGIEGQTYTMKDGKAIFTDLITNNKKGDTLNTKALPLSEAMAYYTRCNYNGPFIQDPGYIEQFYWRPQQAAAQGAWLQVDANATKTVVPPLTFTNAELASEKALKTDIDSYVKRMTTSFILGTADINKEWDTYMATMKKLNIDQLIKNQQQAYDRYLKK